MTKPNLVRIVMSQLHEGLRKPYYRGSTNPYAGYCYIVAEAIYHLTGAKRSKWRPYQLKHEGVSHWFLRTKFIGGKVLDPTVLQFKTRPNYLNARERAFLTSRPSKRAQFIIDGTKLILSVKSDKVKL